MRIGFFLTEFPSISETFILQQIIGFKKRQDVLIFSKFKGDFEKIHPEVKKNNLLEKTSYSSSSKNRLFLLVKAFFCFPVIHQYMPIILNASVR